MKSGFAISLASRLHFDRQNSWKIAHDCIPRITTVGRRVNLTSSCSEVDATGIERIDRHGVAQHIYVAIPLRQTFGEFFPFVTAAAAAIDAQFAIGREMFGVALDR